MERGNSRKRQSGTTAIEFAFVFPVAFALLYACIMFGFVLLIRLGVQHSAEEAVREALRYPMVTFPANATAAERRQQQLSQRASNAIARALNQSGWMSGWAVPQVGVGVCLIGVECVTLQTPAAFPDCSQTTLCQIVVTVTYPYAEHPVVPGLPGFGLLAPNQIQGRARALFDGRALSLL